MKQVKVMVIAGEEAKAMSHNTGMIIYTDSEITKVCMCERERQRQRENKIFKE